MACKESFYRRRVPLHEGITFDLCTGRASILGDWRGLLSIVFCQA